MKKAGLQLTACWLIATGLITLTQWQIPYASTGLSALALVAGVLLICSAIQSRFSEIGLFLLSVWLIVHTCMQLFHLTYRYSDKGLALLAIVSGIFLISHR